LWTAALCFAAAYLVTFLGTRPPEEMSPPQPRTRPAAGAASATATASVPAPTVRRIDRPIRAPVFAIASLVAITMLLAGRRSGLLKGAAAGFGAALAGSAGIGLGLHARLGSMLEPERMSVLVTISALTALMLCTLSGALFGALAERRRRLAEE
jgi:hypothetical protein